MSSSSSSSLTVLASSTQQVCRLGLASHRRSRRRPVPLESPRAPAAGAEAALRGSDSAAREAAWRVHGNSFKGRRPRPNFFTGWPHRRGALRRTCHRGLFPRGLRLHNARPGGHVEGLGSLVWRRSDTVRYLISEFTFTSISQLLKSTTTINPLRRASSCQVSC